MDNQRRGACNHIMAVWDPHSLCPGCRDCFIPDNPCLDALANCWLIQARAFSVFACRRCSLAARARSPDRVSADPWRVRLSGLQGPPRNLLSRDRGLGLTSPRSVVSRDGGRGSPSAASLSSVAAVVVVAFGPATLPFGDRRRL